MIDVVMKKHPLKRKIAQLVQVVHQLVARLPTSGSAFEDFQTMLRATFDFSSQSLQYRTYWPIQGTRRSPDAHSAESHEHAAAAFALHWAH